MPRAASREMTSSSAMNPSSASAASRSWKATWASRTSSASPEEFKAYEQIAYAKGFLMVSASPLTRSSQHAGADFARLQAAREMPMR